MNNRVDVVDKPDVQMPSLTLAFCGFAASTTAVVGLMALLGSLA